MQQNIQRDGSYLSRNTLWLYENPVSPTEPFNLCLVNQQELRRPAQKACEEITNKM